jgi:prepilin-type N-terminal cleavage/methylation domain-containing protein
MVTRIVKRIRGVASNDRRGFTLIETVVALGLLVGVLSGLASVWARTAQATMAARQRTLALQLARDKLEQLAGLSWSVQTVGGVEVLTGDLTTDLSRQPAAGGGFGTSASPSDALFVSRATYADYLDAQGRWVGAGASPPGRARFVRRWMIAHSGAGASEMLVYQVLVTTVATAARLSPAIAWHQQPDVVWICGAKMRRRI